MVSNIKSKIQPVLVDSIFLMLALTIQMNKSTWEGLRAILELLLLLKLLLISASLSYIAKLVVVDKEVLLKALFMCFRIFFNFFF